MLKVAKRSLKNKCLCCNKSFKKGECYHDLRKVFVDFGEVIGITERYCPKCMYKIERSKFRFSKMVSNDNCKHALKEIKCGLIAGEFHVMAPHTYKCLICGRLGV